MKTTQSISRFNFTTIIILLTLNSSLLAQNLCTGTWEGYFMNDFRTILSFTQTGKVISGKIKMYSGDRLLQDDALTKINENGSDLTFYIEAKQTRYNGSFSENKLILSGNFLFPDGSEHPFTAQKLNPDESRPEMKQTTQAAGGMPEYTPDQLQADLESLVTLLRENHPCLYRYIPKEVLEKEYLETKRRLNTGMDPVEFYTIIAPFIAKIRCSHTGLRLPNNYMDQVKKEGNYFPVRVFISGDRQIFAVSTVQQSNPPLSRGDEIVSIDGAPAHILIEKLLSMIPGEGSTETRGINELNRNFHTWFYLLNRADDFAIEYLSGENKSSTILKACRFTDLVTPYIKHPGTLPIEYFHNPEGNSGFIRLPSFMIRDMDRYLFLLDSIFGEIKRSGTEKLVLDLRDNEGGHPIFAAQLLSCLTAKEFTYFKRNYEISEFEPLYNPMQVDPDHFTGELYVFVNGGCLSTTGHLISLLGYYTDAIFIGEEPGSTYTCNDFSYQATLPNTGIEVNIPRTTFETAIPENEREIPFRIDYEVSESNRDRINGIDSYYNLLFTLI